MYNCKWFTGFTPKEISTIAFTLNEVLDRIQHDNEDVWFDYPAYGGLPDRISKRLTGDQVDYLQTLMENRNEDQEPVMDEEVARELARGWY